MVKLENKYYYCQCSSSVKTRIYRGYEGDGEPAVLSIVCAGCLLPDAPQDPLTIAAITPSQEENAPPHNRDVYLAFRNVKLFQEKKKKKKKDLGPKRIRLAISKCQNQDAKKLLDQHGLEALYVSVEGLLTADVFTSADEARHRFPDLFPDMPAGDTQKGEDLPAEPDNESTKLERGGTDGELEDIQTDKYTEGHQVLVHLLLQTQHKLMVQLQQLLEHACYTFAQREMQETLRERDWDCAEAVELHTWMEEFPHRHKTFHTESNRETLEELFKSVAEIRHTAVRRTRTESVQIKKFLIDAEDLIRLLKVQEHLKVVEKLRLDIEGVLTLLDQNAQGVQVRAEKKLLEIAAERARLEQLENVTKAERFVDMWNWQTSAGCEVIKAIEEVGRAISEMDLRDQ